ncbi:ShlB/FhaC/HecB family hemolysin secretion/activation protein, partial [Burkholderia seminalis]|uniref:ShlB/FhaC/HecB family hemolysin secretion/activation protein n=1 Tax=Burkholderia seminalis TaxID=488731 RepID=UPI001CF13F0D
RYGLSGSSGGYTTNSVGLPGVLGMQGIATLEPYVGIDAGKILRCNSSTGEGGSLFGLTTGVRARSRWVSVDVSWNTSAPWPRPRVRENTFYFSASLAI